MKKYLTRGFSLVELMVAMVLGLILVAAITQVFLGNRKTQTIEEAVGRVQESGRLALEFLSDDLRLAGFSGSGELKHSRVPMLKPSASDLCVGRAERTDVLNVANGFDWYDKFSDDAIRVYTKSVTGAWSPSAPPADISATAVANARNGSDLIAIWYAEDSGAEIPKASPVTGVQSVQITYSSGDLCYEQGELAMLSHPNGSVLFRVTNTPGACTGTVSLLHAVGAAGNCTNSLGSIEYDNFSRVMKLQHRVYYVADTGRDNAAGDPVYALRRVTNGIADVELVEGIEFLKLTYGERVFDSQGVSTGSVRYVGPASITAKEGIMAARIGVLAQGLDSVRTDDDASSYELPGGAIGSSVHGGKKTLRRAFVANVEMRNRAE